MKNNIQTCVFCGKHIDDDYYFSLDERDELIMCCANCYRLAKLFIGGPR